MPAIVQLGQLIIPVVLLLWLALMPAGGRMGLVLQSLSVAAEVDIALPLSEGDTVTVGDLLSEMGNSGNSSGPHMHLRAQHPN